MTEWPPKISPPKRRAKLRLGRARLSASRDGQDFGVLVLAVVNSIFLLLLAEFNYRFLLVFGLPRVSGHWDGLGLRSYYDIPGIPFNIPELILSLTIVAISIVLPAMWLLTGGLRGRKRMMGLLVICSLISLGFSCWSIRWEKVHLEDAKSLLHYHELEIEENEGELYRPAVERLRRELEAYRQERDSNY